MYTCIDLHRDWGESGLWKEHGGGRKSNSQMFEIKDKGNTHFVNK